MTQKKLRTEKGKGKIPFSTSPIFWCLALSLFVSAINLSCSSMPTDMRTLVPAETLVYLETNDLAGALQPIVDSKPFNEVAKSKPDFSALKGVQVAVAVTGIETTEEKLSDEHSVGRVQPHFVVVADTHAWNFQAVKFAELKLSSFVQQIYNSEPVLEQTDKNGGKYFVWTASDGRKAYAMVIDSLIYFGNDESAIEKCLAVKAGETDSITKTGNVSAYDPATLASGYVSTDGIAQIANVIGLHIAAEAADEPEVQSAIAGILPQLLRGSITEISWTSTKTEFGIEDNYKVGMPPDIAKVFNETMAPGIRVNPSLIAQLPESVSDATLYNLKDFRLAWRSVLLAAQQQTNPLSGRIIAATSTLFFEPYGITDPELFFDSLGNDSAGRNIVTAKFVTNSEDPVIIATKGNLNDLLKAMTPELKPPKNFKEFELNIWSTPDDSLQIIYDVASMQIGSMEALAKCNREKIVETEDIRSNSFHRMAISKAPVTSASKTTESTAPIVDLISTKKSDNANAISMSYTETRFTKSGMERKTTSDFGLIGSIIAQLGQD